MSLRHRLGAWGELVGRYRRVWSHFWGRRRELDPPELRAEEAEFLPAALALQSAPVSPLGRGVAWLLMLLVAAVLAWAWIGRTDIVVTAQGRIIPGARTKTLAATEVARVQALHVVEGQAVKAGEVLIELDAGVNDSEQDKARGEQGAAELQAARAPALLAALDSGRPPQLPPLPGVDPARWQEAAAHLRDQWRDHAARLDRLDAEIKRYAAELPLAEQRARDYAELAQARDVPRHAWMDKEQARIDLEGQLASLRSQRSGVVAEQRKTAQEARTEAQRLAAGARQEVRKAQAHGALLKITAPIDGTVQQLTAHTVGGVVAAAQPLMQIVPRQGPVEMEVTLDNRDVGFVHAGQPAQVKIDAFEYTRYGTVAAEVAQVASDAVQDEKRGLVYTARLVLKTPLMRIDGQDRPLGPGLSGSVEIRTGSRRIIEYLLSPLIQHGRESLHER